MRKFFHMAMAFRDRAADVGCVLTSHSRAWGALALAWLAALAAVHLGALGIRLYAAADRLTAAWGRILAVRAAAWHDAHGRSRMASQVRLINGLTFLLP